MRRAAVLLITAFVLILFTGILLTNSLTVVQHVTRVTEVAGPVEIKTPGSSGFKTIAEDVSVQAGTVIKTGADAGALLQWADGTRMKVGELTELTINKCRLNKRTKAATSLFKLDVGKIWVDVVSLLSSDSKFEITTPTVTAGVRGTTFSVEVTSTGDTNVCVQEGTVAVDTGGQPVAVPAGSAAEVKTGGNVDVRSLTESESDDVVDALACETTEMPK